MSDPFCKNGIIEAFTCSKSGDDSKNEDGFFFNDNYIAVIDGATSKTQTLYAGRTGGQILKDTVIQTLSSLNGDDDYIAVVDKIQENIFAAKEEFKIEYAAASMIVFSRFYKQLWIIGDCQARVGNKLICYKHKIDSVLAQSRSMAIRAFLKQGYTVDQLRENDIARELILPFLKLQRYFENTDGKFGYYVLNTDPPAEDPVMITKVHQLKTDDEVVLASDGYPDLKNTLAESEKSLARILKNDPLLYKKYPSTKGVLKGNISFDDRTYIKFIV